MRVGADTSVPPPVYYNDSDPFVCDWLRNLITAGLIPAGDVDSRKIEEVSPEEVRGYTQCHFFAGIGGWAHALRLAAWPAERPVWTGSCPCQPLSAAGQQRAADDERHLWPEWYRLIRECRPTTVFGEQVASKLGRLWLTAVRVDLEELGFAVGAADLCAAGVGAPHIRQRLYFVADRDGSRRGAWRSGETGDGCNAPRVESTGLRAAGIVGNTEGGDGEIPVQPGGSQQGHAESRGPSTVGRMADAKHAERGSVGIGQENERDGGDVGRTEAHSQPRARREVRVVADAERGAAERRGRDVGSAPSDAEGQAWERKRVRIDPWAGCEFIPCTDGKARPTQSGLFPLAYGLSGRVGRLRAYGNAIVPEVAAAFIEAYQEVMWAGPHTEDA